MTIQFRTYIHCLFPNRWLLWPRAHKAFHDQDQDQAQVSNRIISGLFPIICSKELDLCIHCHVNVEQNNTKMHEIKVHFGDN